MTPDPLTGATRIEHSTPEALTCLPYGALLPPMSNSGLTCPHCGLPLSAMQVAALVSILGVRTRKRRSLDPQHGREKLLVPYPQLRHPARLARLPKV